MLGSLVTRGDHYGTVVSSGYTVAPLTSLHLSHVVAYTGDFSLQDLLTANPDLAEAPSWIPQQVNTATGPEEPSPLLRWTSDGSMMEELLKT